MQGGWAFGQTSPDLTVPVGSNISGSAIKLATSIGRTGFDTDDVSFGVQAGYNWQRGTYVFGLEGDVNYINLTDTNITNGLGGISGRAIDRIDANLFASLRSRAGFQSGNFLFYATGGIAFTDAKFSRAIEWTADPCPLGSTGLRRCHVGDGSFDVGYTIGGGAEIALSAHLSMKAEYLYADFGKATFRTTNAHIPDQYLDHSAKLDFHTLRVGLNYKF